MIEINISRNDWPEPATDFDMGELSFLINEEKLSTLDSPKKSCMIFLSLIELMDILTSFGKINTGEFVAADSSFALVFKRKNALLTIFKKKEEIATVNKDEFSLALHKGLSRFLQDHRNVISGKSAVWHDFSESLVKFKESLSEPA